MREYKSFYKTVSGNEGQKCHYPTRLDTYGCGCAHNCQYCYAKSLLDFRGLWNPEDPSVADIKKIERTVKSLTPGTVLRLGGMTDCFQPCEKEYRVTYNTIKLLNKHKIHYLIVTKSDLVADDEYISILDKELAHIQITVTSTNDALASTYESATPPSKRIAAIEKLEKLGFDVQIRLSPFIPEFLDFNIINNIRCHKAIVEFLRINPFIRKTFTSVDYSKYTHKESGYHHLELQDKIELLDQLKTFSEISICEDCTEAYEYWKHNVNFNKDDCCNLRLHDSIDSQDIRYIGSIKLLDAPKTVFLSSNNAPDNVIIASKKWAYKMSKDQTCVVSGFQSNAEKEVLDVLLNNGGIAVMVLANALFKKCPKKYQNAVNENRLLIVSYFDDKQPVVTRQSAEARNRKVIELGNSVVVGSVKPGGMIEAILQNDFPNYTILE